MSTTEVALDPERALESAMADVGDALSLRRRAADDAALRAGIRAVADGGPGSPEELSPRDAARRATALFLLGRDAEVGRFAERADLARVRQLWALSELYRDRAASAASILETALQMEPRDERARLELAALQALLGRPADARATLGALASQVDRVDVLFALGAIAEAEGDYNEARSRYEAVLANDPDNVDARARLAFHHDLTGDDETAIALYEQARRVRPTRVNVLLNLGVLYEDAGEFEKAAACYREILDRFPDHARARPFLRDAESSKSMVYDEDMEKKEDRRNQLLRTPVSDFELSVRSRNCLAKMNIQTLGDLIQRTEQELLAYKNFGETSLEEIKNLLASKGLRLGMRREEVQLPAEEPLLPEPSLADFPDLEDIDAELLLKPISDLDLSVRSMKCMQALEIETVGDLLRHSEEELLAAKNFGQTSLEEIRAKLAKLGISLRQD
jgi:DNA-directed RNA polymerase subunit alpha